MTNSKIGNSYEFARGVNPFNAAKNNDDLKKVKQDPVQVIARIIRNQHSQYNKEISHWKMARLEAEDVYNPRRVYLTELYDDIFLDAFIRGIMTNKRILKISNKPFKIVSEDDKEKQDLFKLLDKGWFNDVIKYAMESRFYGYSLIYLWEMVNTEFTKTKLVPRKHVVPDKNVWLVNEYDQLDAGFDYTKAPFNNYMLGVGKPEELGIFNSAAPLYILKKHSWANWDEFEEIFGVPMRIAKLASQDAKVKAEVEGWLRSMGTAPYAIFPTDAELDIKENTRPDAHQVFNEKRKAANEELEILMLGLKSATQETGTYGKEKVNQEEQNEVVIDDKTFITHLMNDSVIPLLRKNGYPFADGDKFKYDDAEIVKPKDKVVIFKAVKDMGYTLNQDQVQKDTGVIITGETEPESVEADDQLPATKKKNVQKKKSPAKTIAGLNNLYFNHE